MSEINWDKVRVQEVNVAPERRREKNFLYIDDLAWFRRAFAATGSKEQFAFALLLYRHCRMRKKAGEDPAVISRTLLDGLDISHDARGRAIRRLEVAGLVWLDKRRPGYGYRVRVIPTRGSVGGLRRGA